MKKLILLPILSCACVATTLGATPVLDLDFTAGEGFTEGAVLSGTQNMDTQGGWTAADVAGTGMAVVSTPWNRARNLSLFTLEVGHSVVIETTLRLSDADGVYNDGDNFMLGFAHSAQHAGTNTPSIGSSIATASDGSYSFGDGTTKLFVSAAASNDWIKFTQTITRGTNANEFVGFVSATNLTAGVDLGEAPDAWMQSTDDGSWGGDMRPSFRVWQNAAGTELQIDRWTVSTITNAPVDPPEIPVTNQVTVAVDLTRRRSIAGTTSMDREQWFGVYHETGYARNQFTDGGVTMSRDEWIYEEGRMWPSRGTFNFQSFAEDPARPSYVDPTEFYKFNGVFDGRYAWAKQQDPNHKTVFSGEGHGKYPAYMCWDPALTHNVKTVSNNVANAEAYVRTLDQLKSRNGLMPKWLEVMNESSIQNNYGWHWDADAWDKLSAFHTEVATAVDASQHTGQIKVVGPTDAYPFRDGSSGDFSQWQGSDKKFILQAGDKMHGYAIHTYEQMVTNSASSFDDQYTVPEIWHLGRLPAFVDLWENEHHIAHGGTKPFVFSEYGLLTNRNPYGDRNAYYQVRSCNGILLSLMDRPDVVDKMSAFLMSQAPYNWNQKRVFFASEDSGATMYKTSYFEYLRFWRDLEGDYLFSSADTQHIVVRSFLQNNNTLYVVMKNNHNTLFNVDLQTLLPAGASVGAAEIQRIYFNGVDDVARDPFGPLASLSDIQLVPDETVMIRVAVSSMPAVLTWEERNHYSDRVLVPMTASAAETFLFDVPRAQIGRGAEGRVNISLYSLSGFGAGPATVEVNGVVVTNVPDVSYTLGATRSWKQIAVDVPAGILTQGANSVVVTPTEGGGTKKITSVRLTTIAATGDVNSDGVPDWWMLEHNLDPFVDATLVDTDLDGFSDHDEYICDTDPNDGNDYFRLEILSSGSGVDLVFDSATNRFYTVNATDDLVANNWAEITNGVVGNDAQLIINDPTTATNRFYHLEVLVE